MRYALCSLYFERGQAAIAKGWLARAEDWAAEVDEPATNAMILWMKSKMAAFDGEPEQALSLADDAYNAVRHKGAVGIEALSLVFRGFYRLCLGDTRAGLADQDHAAALALSSTELDPVLGGISIATSCGRRGCSETGRAPTSGRSAIQASARKRHGADGLLPASPDRKSRRRGSLGEP